MNTGETMTRIGRTFEVHESLGKRYIKCDRCEKQWNSVTDAAQCCAEPGEQKKVKTLKKNEAYWAKLKAKRVAGGGTPDPDAPAQEAKPEVASTVAVERKKPGPKPGQKNAAKNQPKKGVTPGAVTTWHKLDASLTVNAPCMLPEDVNGSMNTLLAAIDARLAALTQARAALESFRTLLSGGAA